MSSSHPSHLTFVGEALRLTAENPVHWSKPLTFHSTRKDDTGLLFTYSRCLLTQRHLAVRRCHNTRPVTVDPQPVTAVCPLLTGFLSNPPKALVPRRTGYLLRGTGQMQPPPWLHVPPLALFAFHHSGSPHTEPSRSFLLPVLLPLVIPDQTLTPRQHSPQILCVSRNLTIRPVCPRSHLIRA